MSRWRARAARLTLLVGLATLTGSLTWSTGAALAASTAELPGTVFDVHTTPGRMTMGLEAKDGQDNAEIDPASVRVSLTPTNGGAPPAPIVPDARGTGTAEPRTARAVVLAIDTSGSMKTNGYFKIAQQAATRFVRGLPNDVSVGLVQFGDPAKVVLAPTKNQDAVVTAIRGLTTDGNTAMYQAVQLAVEQLGTTASRTVVMLTDGKNDDQSGKETSAREAQQALVERPKFRQPAVDFAGILVGDEKPGDIEQIAGAGAVQKLDGTGDLEAQLAKFFDQRTTNIERQLQLSLAVPASITGVVRISVVARTTDGRKITAVGGDYPTQQASTSPSVPLSTPDGRLASVTTPIALAALGGLFLAVAVLTFLATGALAGGTEKESEVVRRLSVYSVAGVRPQQISVTEQSTRLGDSAVARSAVGLMTRVARTGQLDRALDSRLEAAGLPWRTAEWMLLHIGSAVGASLLLLIAARGSVVAMLLGLVLGLVLPWLVLNLLKSRREGKFLGQLPDTLQLLSGSLASGYSLPQAMDSVAREARAPVSEEFNRALIEARLGMLPEDALDGIAARTGSRDFSWIVMAIRIQRDIGGNLAELLSTVADTLRERERLRRQVSALSAEGRLSGLILGALPILFAVYLVVVRPEYIGPLFTTRIGLFLLAVGSVTLAIGAIWMSRIIKVEV